MSPQKQNNQLTNQIVQNELSQQTWLAHSYIEITVLQLTPVQKKFIIDLQEDYKQEFDEYCKNDKKYSEQFTYLIYFYKGTKIQNINSVFYVNGKTIEPSIKVQRLDIENHQTIIPIPIQLHKGQNTIDLETILQIDCCKIEFGCIYQTYQIYNQLIQQKRFASNKMLINCIQNDSRFQSILNNIYGDQWITILKNIKSNKIDTLVDSMSYSLINSKTQGIIYFPIHPMQCKHQFKPTDLEFIRTQAYITGALRCGVCNQIIKFEDLQVDIFGWLLKQITFQQIVQINSDGTNNIETQQSQQLIDNSYEDSGWSQ